MSLFVQPMVGRSTEVQKNCIHGGWWLHCVNNSAVDFIRMGIEYKEKLIGYIDLACIKETTAELGIAIGESRLWGKGLGVTSALWMID